MTGTSGSSVPYRDDLRRVERAGGIAWPALETTNVDGWVWRHSGGGFGRSNSVFTLDFDGADVDAAIARIELYYQFRGRRARFRLSDVSEPPGLQAKLEARGYKSESGGVIMAKAVDRRRHELEGVEWTSYPTPNWLRVYLGVVDEPRQRTVADLLAAVPAPRAFVSMRKRGLTFSSGLGTIEDGIVTIECIATREELRGRGGARAILGGIETWAQQEAAHTLHLQVADTNATALRLYKKFGFAEVGRYAYWVPEAIDHAPYDDGEGAKRFPVGKRLPPVTLSAVSGAAIDPTALPGRTVVAIYPWTGGNGLVHPSEWNEILGAHGSTPELEGFRDLAAEFEAQNVRVLAVSEQGTEHQREMAGRLKLRFDVLSDATCKLREAWALPTFRAGKDTFLRRVTLILEAGKIVHAFDPVHSPGAHARQVLDWLAENPAA
jgi:N-acetylglutamate synthase